MKQVYLDYNATTPMDQRVFDAMEPYFVKKFGNASSRHPFGWEAKEIVENTRKSIETEINGKTKEIIFTSGATESINLAIKGICQSKNIQKNHIITQVTEHKAVLDTCGAMEKLGFRITYIDVDNHGIVHPEKIKDAICPDTLLIAIMHANNEIGVIQPIDEIGKICKEKDVLFLVDAAQTFGKLSINVREMNIDFLVGTGHKIYGPKGIGFLYINSGKHLDFIPQIHGGGHERGWRAGTLPVPQIAGFGKAIELCKSEREDDNNSQSKLRKILMDEILISLPDTIINGSMVHRLPNNINFSFPGTDGDSLLMKLEHIAVSSGSACTSATMEPSYVLRALGLNNNLAKASIRVGFGRFTTEEDVRFAASEIIKAVR